MMVMVVNSIHEISRGVPGGSGGQGCGSVGWTEAFPERPYANANV